MPDINATVKRFENGGIVEIVDGATTHTVLNIEPGSLRVTPPKKGVVEFTDRGTPQTPVVGDDTYARLSFSAKLGKLLSDSLLTLSRAEAAASNNPKAFTVRVKFPAYRGAPNSTAGNEQITFSNAFFTSAPALVAGSTLDQYQSIEIACVASDFAVASF